MRYAISVIASAAIDGSIIFGQEWDLCLHSALCTNDRMHFAGGAFGSPAHAPFIATPGAATGATTRLIHQTFLLIELLFAGGKDKVVSAFTAFEGFVNETQTREPPCDMVVFLQVYHLAESPACLSPLAARD